MSSNIAIKVDGLGKCYQIYDKPRDRLLQMMVRSRKQLFREFWALQNISFEIKRGETVGIIGRNGSGKSTLLQLICGTLNQTTGSLEVNGRVAALLELGAGFNPEFTGRENVFLAASLYGLTQNEITSRFDQITEFADIGDFIDQPVKTYSSGMFLRLAFSVIAHVDADILVIDEALAVGDAFFIQKCMRFLRRHMEHGTLLFVSHDSAAVVNLCQRAIWLEHGKLRAMASSKFVTEQYLAEFYESQQGKSKALPVGSPKNNRDGPRSIRSTYDQRMDFINRSNLRNDLEVFSFTPEASGFGLRGATVEDVRFCDNTGNQLTWIVGGESVSLEVEFQAHQPLSAGAIVGFSVNDRLGQVLFGDNTYLTYREDPVVAGEGVRIIARFAFTMPILPYGQYTVTVAVAEGSQQEHVQHHWIHDALMIESHSSSVCTGLVGIHMDAISMVMMD
ncbi:MAG: ABC transporter ATP-binding protein [Candidatus Methylumidiphilus sp.]